MASLSSKVKKLKAEGKSSAFINKFIRSQTKKNKQHKSTKKIVLKAPKRRSKRKEIKRRFAKALDVTSAILLEPTTFIKNPSKAGDIVRDRREDIRKTGDLSKALDVVGETLTATAIGAGLILGASNPAVAGRLALKALPKTLKGQIGAVTAGGILITSETARKFTGKFIQDPTKIGREAGLLIDKVTSKEGSDSSIMDALKSAGLIGAGVVAGGLVVKKLFGKNDKTADAVVNSPGQVPSSVALPVSPIPTSTQAVTSEPVVKKLEVDTPPIVSTPDINVKVINKPQVNVAVAQSL